MCVCVVAHVCECQWKWQTTCVRVWASAWATVRMHVTPRDPAVITDLAASRCALPEPRRTGLNPAYAHTHAHVVNTSDTPVAQTSIKPPKPIYCPFSVCKHRQGTHRQRSDSTCTVCVDLFIHTTAAAVMLVAEPCVLSWCNNVCVHMETDNTFSDMFVIMVVWY